MVALFAMCLSTHSIHAGCSTTPLYSLCVQHCFAMCRPRTQSMIVAPAQFVCSSVSFMFPPHTQSMMVDVSVLCGRALFRRVSAKHSIYDVTQRLLRCANFLCSSLSPRFCPGGQLARNRPVVESGCVCQGHWSMSTLVLSILFIVCLQVRLVIAFPPVCVSSYL